MGDMDREALQLGAVRTLLAREEQLVERVNRIAADVAEPASAKALVERLGMLAHAHIDALRAYLEQAGGTSPTARAGASATVAATTADGDFGRSSAALRDLFVEVNALAIGYTALHAAAMRLFEPPLRQLAPRHLRDCAEVAQAIALLLPQVVALELAERDLACLCPCPMCSLGVCGCVAGATSVVSDAWRETAPKAAEQPGYLLQAPRPGSQLAALAVPGGAYLLSVNGVRVPEHSAPGVQAAIAPCPHGEDIRLEVLAGGESREIVVRRADAAAGP